MNFSSFGVILPKNRKIEKKDKRKADVALPHWPVPIRCGSAQEPLDLNKMNGRDLPVPVRDLNRTWPSDLDLTDQDLGFWGRAAGATPVTRDGRDAHGIGVPAKTEGSRGRELYHGDQLIEVDTVARQ